METGWNSSGIPGITAMLSVPHQKLGNFTKIAEGLGSLLPFSFLSDSPAQLISELLMETFERRGGTF